MLTDAFGRVHNYLRISLTEKCNLRCIYCMPAEGVPLSPKANLLQDDELLRLVRLFAQNGVSKIRCTGGEPLVRKNAVSLIAQIAQISGIEKVAITTNGLLLEEALPALKSVGVKGLNISIDTLDAHKFKEITRRNGFEKVMSAIEKALSLGFHPHINVVAMRGINDDEFIDFARWTMQEALTVRFIEFMPFDGNRWSDTRFMAYQEILAGFTAHFEMEQQVGNLNDTAINYKIKGAKGQIGFIASMSQPFCAGCNRLRLGADGHFKVCLFGKPKLNLRDALRQGFSDAHLMEQIKLELYQKKAQHDGMYALTRNENQPMIIIGG